MLLKIAKYYIPEYIKKRKLGDLFRITADAFQCEAPILKGLPFRDRLQRYARFTREQAERYLYWEGSPDEKKGRIDAVEERLYCNSFMLGKDLRESLRIRTKEQATEALGLIYGVIGIDFQIAGPDGAEGGGPGISNDSRPVGFIINKCFFSSCYSAEVCALISSLDKGMAAGLTGGGRLDFNRRITEGCGCCSGFFTLS